MMLSNETLTEIDEASSISEKKLRCAAVGISYAEFRRQMKIKHFFDSNEPTYGGAITRILVHNDPARVDIDWDDDSEVVEELIASAPGCGQIIRTNPKHITIESRYFSDKLFDMLNESVEFNFELSDFDKKALKRRLAWIRCRQPK